MPDSESAGHWSGGLFFLVPDNVLATGKRELGPVSANVEWPNGRLTQKSKGEAEARPAQPWRGPSGPRPSPADNSQHFVALLLHQCSRLRLEVQAQQRLGIRRADVEVPVGVIDRHTIHLLNLGILVTGLDGRQ